MACIANKTHLYELLGQIVVSFKALEQGVDGLILGSLDSPVAQGFSLLNSMTFQQKIPAMNNLIRALHSDQELGPLDLTLNALVERCLACERERDNWVCSYWVPEVQCQSGFVIRLQGSVDSRGLIMEPIDLSELKGFIVVLNATVAYLCGFHQKLSNNFNRVRAVKLVESFLNMPVLVVQD